MSLALYRKYRPGSFAEVKGQDHVTGPLRQALLNGRIHHAYLFSGPRGCGKTSSARILARSLNCEQGPTPDPCGVCASCVALAPNGPGSLDVIEIDAASHNGVDDARDLRDKAFFAPVSARFKVYIIDEAHMVTAAAFNALLKLVEEPPEFVKFVFATTEPERVLQTIRSRTHHYPFRLMPRRDLTALLEEVIAAEGIAVEPQVVPLVVRAAAGSARDGLSILDQVLASSGADGVTREDAAGLLGVTPDVLLDDVLDAFAVGDAAAVFSTVDRVMEGGHDPRRFGADVLERLRDLVILEAVPDAGAKGVLDCPAEQLERMARQVAAFGPAGLSRAADLFAAGLTEMRGTTAPRLQLELLCARVLLPTASSDAVVARVERLERRFDIESPTPTVSVPTRPAAPVRAPAPGQPDQPGIEVRAPAGGGQGSDRGSARPAPARPDGPPGAGPDRAQPAARSAGGGASAAYDGSSADRARPGAPGTGGGNGNGNDNGAGTPGTTVPASTAPRGAAPDSAATGADASAGWPTAAEPGRRPAVPTAGGPSSTGSTTSGAPAGAPADGAGAHEGPGNQEPGNQGPGHGGRAAPSSGGPGGALDAAEVRRAWGTVLEKVQESKRVTHARLLETTVAALEGRRLSVSFTTPTLARQFMTGVHVDTLRDALKEVLGADLEVVCVSGAGHTPPAGSPGPGAPRGGPAPSRGRPEPPVHEGFAPGDEAAPDDPDVPVERGEDAALRLVERALGGRVVGTIGD